METSSESSYVNRCLTLQYEEVPENRNFNDIPEVQEVAHLTSTDRIDEAMRLAKSLPSKYPDLDLVYLWLGILHGKRGTYDDARAVLKKGLKKCKRRYLLCNELGKVESKARNLPEAMYWWVQSILLQESINEYPCAEPLVHLSKIAHQLVTLYTLGVGTRFESTWHTLRRLARTLDRGGSRPDSEVVSVVSEEAARRVRAAQRGLGEKLPTDAAITWDMDKVLTKLAERLERKTC